MKLLIKQLPENVDKLLYAALYGYRPDEPPCSLIFRGLR